MKHTIRCTFILIGLLSLIACSGKGKKSQANVSLNLGNITGFGDNQLGGAMLYGRSDSGESFGMRIDDKPNVEIELNNSTWNFYAFSWDGDHNNDNNVDVDPRALTGEVFCGFSPGITLDGGEINVPLNLSNANCDNPEFAPARDTGPVKFPALEFSTCRGPQTGVSSDSSTCDTDDKGYATSIAVMLVPYRPDGFIEFGNAIKGPCYSLSAPGTGALGPDFVNSANVEANIPIGNGNNLPVKTVLRTYFGTENCDDGDPKGFWDQLFNHGLTQPNPDTKAFPYNSGSEKLAFFQWVPEGVACDGPRNGNTFPAFGDTTNSYWHGICNKDQLMDIGGANWIGNSNSSKNMILLKDINFYAGFDPASGGEPPSTQFEMLGETIGNQPTNPTAYTGTFEGNGKRIIGMEIDMESAPTTIARIGFIRYIGASGSLHRLEFILPLVEGNDYDAHTEFGVVTGVNQGTISDVHINYGEVEGRSRIGGVVGFLDGGSVTDVSSKETEVEGYDKLGGLTGEVSGTPTISQIKINGDVTGGDHNDGWCTINENSQYGCEVSPGGGTWTYAGQVGGVFGFYNSTSTVDQVTFKGAVSGARNIGGIAGEWQNGTLDDSYALGVSLASGDHLGDANVGGIFGKATNFNMNRVFFAMGTQYGNGNNKNGVVGSETTATTINNVYSIDATGVTGGTQLSYDQMRDAQDGNMAPFTSGAWVMDDDYDSGSFYGGDVPRLAIEQTRDCQGLFSSVNFAGGTGTTDDPYLICNKHQFFKIRENYGSQIHYRLMRPIDLTGESSSSAGFLFLDNDTNSIPDDANIGFSGTFDGDGFFVAGGTITTSTATTKIGLFDRVAADGILSDFTYIAGGFDTSIDTMETGFITGINEGLIESVSAFGDLKGNTVGAGHIAGVNHGAIAGAQTVGALMGKQYVGGIAGRNLGGAIYYSESGVSIFPGSDHVKKVGGIAGENATGSGFTFDDIVKDTQVTANGHIYQSSFSGHMVMKATSPLVQSYFQWAGGLVGINSGIVEACETYAQFDLGDGVIYQGAWDATTADPSGGDLEAWYVSNAGTTNLDGITTWNIGDWAIRLKSGNWAKMSWTRDNTGMSPASSTLVAVSDFGFCVGRNESGGTMTNLLCNGNSNYTAGNPEFDSTMGHLYGVNNGGSVSYNITKGGFNYPGQHMDHIDPGNNNYFFAWVNSEDKLVHDAGHTASVTSNILTGSGDYTAFTPALSSGMYVRYGFQEAQISTIDNATQMTLSSGPDDSGDLYIFEDEVDWDPANFFTGTMLWDVGTDHDEFHEWYEEGGNTFPHLGGYWMWKEDGFHEEMVDLFSTF